MTCASSNPPLPRLFVLTLLLGNLCVHKLKTLKPNRQCNMNKRIIIVNALYLTASNLYKLKFNYLIFKIHVIFYWSCKILKNIHVLVFN